MSSALIGFGEVRQIDEAIEAIDKDISALESAEPMLVPIMNRRRYHVEVFGPMQKCGDRVSRRDVLQVGGLVG